MENIPSGDKPRERSDSVNYENSPVNRPIHHATVLNLHQPPGNLEFLLDNEAWEAESILYALDRIPRALWSYEDVGRVHLSLSGTLLETLSNPDFQARVYGIVKCGDLLWNLRNPAIEVLGTGYYHPVLPLIPEADREEHILRWLGIARHLFERQHFPGFWPPEMGFSMELIPLLKRLGFRYVLVDSEHVEPIDPMGWHEIRYRPHVARHHGEEIIVVVRDRELSNAQESGMDPDWFIHESNERTRNCEWPPLVTTSSDGDNGGWFRNTNWSSNYWGAFYQPLMDRVRAGTAEGLAPVFIHDYLDRYGAHGEVRVNTGAWNTGDHSGHGFVQWTGSQAQRDTLARIAEMSDVIHDLRWREGQKGWPDGNKAGWLEQAMWRLLRAETSCNLYWGDAWTQRSHDDLDDAQEYIDRVEAN